MTAATSPEEIITFVLDTAEPLPDSPPAGLSLSMLWQIILGFALLVRQMQAQVVELQAELRLQRAKRFGRSSEKQPASADETATDTPTETSPSTSPATDEGETASDEPGSSPPRKRGAQPGHRGSGRHNPAHLPRETQWVELPEEERSCPECGQAYKDTGLTEDSEEIDVQIKVRVIRYRRKRYERQCDCEGSRLVTAPIPPKLIPKGKFSSRTWAKFLIDKYYASLPLRRQIDCLGLVGLPISAGTVLGGFQRLQDYLTPLYQFFLEQLRITDRLHADETRWRVFEEVQDKTSQRWWLWVFISETVVGYVLDPSRSAAVPKKTLSTPVTAEEVAHLQQQAQDDNHPMPEIIWLNGQAYILSPHLQTISADRYIVYKVLSDQIQVAFCWAHVRRDFVDFKKAHANQPDRVAWAEDWINAIAHLYQLNDHRLAVRTQPELFAQAQAALEAAVAQMAAQLNQLSDLTPKQQKILTSLKNHWAGLILFVTNPDIPMDNNLAERKLRNPVIGRKNYSGHHARWSGEQAAQMFTIIQTCLLHGINPYTFLVYYFEECARLGTAPSDLERFAPWLLKQSGPIELLLKPP